MKRLWFIISLFFLLSCNIKVPHQPYNLNNVPVFNADSAYNLIQKLVSYGPRVPNSPAHDSCAKFISATLKKYGLIVQQQHFETLRFDSLPLSGTNIFASLNPEKKQRILLFTHWDTRFMAERDKDKNTRNLPILGANDGGSGTAVLLELARDMSQNPPNIGVDFLFLDIEDQGPPEVKSMMDYYKYWALGARYWAAHKPQNYNPLWGIEVDLVGGHNTRFSIEDYSLYYYGYLIKRVWEIASALGYDSIFVNFRSHGLFDDHVVINEMTGIRSILIIENIPHKYFGDYWHTHNDNINIIDKHILKAVGQTVLATIYNTK